MPFIEIWKSKPTWRQVQLKERDRVIEELKRMTRAARDIDDDKSGPFLFCREPDCLLIWEVRAEEAPRLRTEYEKSELAQYFEQVMFGEFEGLRARDWLNDLLE